MIKTGIRQSWRKWQTLWVITSLYAEWVPAAYGRTFTVYNGCPFTIWPAIFTDLTAGTAVPNFPTGWEAAPFTAVTFSVPDNWTAGRIWVCTDDSSWLELTYCASAWIFWCRVDVIATLQLPPVLHV